MFPSTIRAVVPLASLLLVGLFVAVGSGSAWAEPAPQKPTETPPVLSKSAPQSAEQLLGQLSKIRSLQAKFVERKKLALLRLPLKSSGTLYYLQPGRIVREVNTPEPSIVRINSGSLKITDRAGVRELDLKSRPDLRIFVESFTRVLSGDRAALTKHYKIQFQLKKLNVWTLTLKPLRKPLNQLIASIQLQGTGQTVEQLNVVEARGDRTETLLSDVRLDPVFSKSQLKQIFGEDRSPPSAPPITESH